MKTFKDPFAPTPEGFHLRVEQTLDGLEEREMTKRKLTASLAVAMVLVMLMATAAVAGVTGGYVGWDGVYHSYEESTEIDPPEDYDTDVDDPYYDILSTIPRGERWVVTKDGEEVDGASRRRFAYDAEEFARMIEGTALPMPVLPKGYVYLYASFLTEPEETPYSEVTLADGAVLSKYKNKEPVPGEVTNYDYTFGNPNGGHEHSIMADIVPAQDWLIDDGPVVYLNGDEEVEAVQIDGYEYGLYHVDPTGFAQLHLLQPMGDEMLIVDVHAFEDLPKEAMLNLFNPEGNIDLSGVESTYTPLHTSGVDFTAVPEGEYWIARWTPDEKFMEGRRHDAKLSDFNEIARLTADANLPVPAVPEGWNIEHIYSMPPVEDRHYEEITADNSYILYKYRLHEVAEGQLNHYRFWLDGSDEAYISGEVFPAAELEAESEWMSDFTYADEIDFPGFEEARFVSADYEDDNNEYLLTVPGEGAYVYIRTSADVPAETVLSLFPAE